MSINVTLAAKQSAAIKHRGRAEVLRESDYDEKTARFLEACAEHPKHCHVVFHELKAKLLAGCEFDEFHELVYALAKQTMFRKW